MNEKTSIELLKRQRDFAARLHAEFCTLSHTDRCSWNYERYAPDSGWLDHGSAHRWWFNKSVKTLSVFAGYTEDQMVSIIRFVKTTI